jgi:hypothetical protein
MVLVAVAGQSQDKNERITRDIEVAENVLGTLIRQELERKSNFWLTEVKGSYTPGFGVTLRVPYENLPYAFSFSYSDGPATPPTPATPGWAPVTEDVIGTDNGAVIRKSYREEGDSYYKDKEKLKQKRTAGRDSARSAYGDRLLEASKTFLADYGDLISIEPNERILITTKSERGRNYNYVIAGDFKTAPYRVISVEATKSDLTQYKQGKLTRDQLMAKFKVMNSEVNEEKYPDLELLSTIFNRLYRSDLSKTYFTSSNPYYERLKDFGVTYFMHVYSSNEAGYGRWNMPTVDLEDIDQATRDKKVTELYPAFEKDLKDNILEYGRTLNSLKDEEVLNFDVTLTKCKGCGIPSTLELSVKASVLKEFGSGKIMKEAAITKINVKKGPGQ